MTIGLATNQASPEDTVNQMVHGYLSVALTVGTDPNHLTDSQQTFGTLNLTGALTQNLNVTVDDGVVNRWLVKNATTNAYTVTFKTETGTGITLNQGEIYWLYSDGTNVLDGTPDFVRSAGTATLSDLTLTGDLIVQVTGTVTAFATGGQGSATQLTTGINEISTCATAGDSVKLPAAVAGLTCMIINNGAAACDVFPASGDNIGGGVDTAVSLAVSTGITYACYDGTNWRAV